MAPLDPNLTSSENAYALWERYGQSNGKPDIDVVVEQITLNIFFKRKDSCWYGFILHLFSGLAQYFIRKDVDNALAAYKFDLITSRQEIKAHWLFTPNESSCIRIENRDVFGSILSREQRIASIADKAARWREKAEKYHHDSPYMITSAALEAIAQR